MEGKRIFFHFNVFILTPNFKGKQAHRNQTIYYLTGFGKQKIVFMFKAQTINPRIPIEIIA